MIQIIFRAADLIAHQLERELPARHEITLPRRADIGIAIGRGQIEIQLTHAKQIIVEGAVGFGVGESQRGCDEVRGAFIFWLRARETIKQNHTQHRFDVAARVEKSLRGFLDDLLRRIARDEATS